MLWVPGTSQHSVNPGFAQAARAAFADGDVSLHHLEYEASWNIRPSVATGVATLRLVLAGIADIPTRIIISGLGYTQLQAQLYQCACSPAPFF